MAVLVIESSQFSCIGVVQSSSHAGALIGSSQDEIIVLSSSIFEPVNSFIFQASVIISEL
jgi:hypothetical protein